MIDPRILKLLESRDKEARKKAVMALAKTKDQDALPYLAKIYKNDPEVEIRELARKAGVYIKKHTEEEEADVYEEDDDTGYSYQETSYDDDYEEEEDSYSTSSYSGGSLYYDEDEEEEPEEDLLPLPSEIKVSQADVNRSIALRDQAVDWNMRGNNEKAADFLTKALKANPQLLHDSYTVSLAGTIMGTDGPQAIKLLAPSADELKKRKGGAGSGQPTSAQGLLAIFMAAAAAVVLLGYLTLPWIDMSSVPMIDETTGEQTTLGNSLDEAKELFDAVLALGGSEADTPEMRRMRDAINGVTVEINGLNTTLVSVGQMNILEAMGIMDLIDMLMGIMGGSLGAEGLDIDAAMAEFDAAMPEPEPLDYTLPLVPVAAVLAILLGLIILARHSTGMWILCILIGLIGVGPMLYFYLQAVNSLVPDDFDVSGLGGVTVPDATSLIGMGFWVSFAAMMVVVIVPFLAMLIAPVSQEAAA